MGAEKGGEAMEGRGDMTSLAEESKDLSGFSAGKLEAVEVGV